MKKILTCIVFLAVLLAIATGAHAQGWVRPNAWTNGSNWTNGDLAYDNSINTYASNAAPGGGMPRWGGWITFTLPATYLCNQIKVFADYGQGHVDGVQMDVSPDNTNWTTIHNGAIYDGEWFATSSFTPQNVRYIRFRYHYYAGNYNMWLNEIAIYNCPSTINAPTITTLDAVSVDTNSAKFQGQINNDGGATCLIRFEYGATLPSGVYTAWQPSGSEPGYNTGDTFGTFQAGFTTGSTYQFRAIAQNSAGTTVGSTKTVTPAVPGMGVWIDPTSTSDDPSPPAVNSGQWTNRSYAHDDDAKTAASLAHNQGDTSPGMYLYLNHAAIPCDKVTIAAKKTSDITGMDIDVYKNGAWVNVLSNGTFTDNTALTVTFTAGSVTQARVRFYTNNVGIGLKVYAFDFHIGAEHCRAFIDGAFSGAAK